MLPARMVPAQAVSPHVSLTRPNGAAANRLDALRTTTPSVAVFNSQYTAEKVPGGRQAVRDAVYQWELLLLGLNLPYRIIEDRDLARGVPGDTRLLILPAAEALSDGQRRQVRRFLERGGGVLASGRVGAFDERGRNEGDVFFRELFGAELVTGLPEQPSGILQALDGGHPPTLGLPMGYRLNLAPQTPTAAARPVRSAALGRPYTYTTIPAGAADPFDGLTLALYGTYGEGNVFWTRFHPQDVSRETEQQAVYQALIINAMAYLAEVPAVGLRPWPGGHASATVFAARPLIGNDAAFAASTHRALDALEAAQATGTFFLTSDEAALFPDLVQRIDRLGEVALSGDSDDVLKKEPVETQRQRLDAALSALRPLASRPIIGLFPPGGFYDVNTVRAMRDAGLRYLHLSTTGESAAPRALEWYRDADYRETLFADASGRAGTPARRMAAGDRIVALPATGRDDYTVLTLLNTADDAAAQFAAYRDDFNRVHAARGLYVLPYHAELQAESDERAAVLRQMAEYARRQNSWITTFRDVYNWWLQHEALGVAVADVTDHAITFEVTNASNQPAATVSFDVIAGRPVASATADHGADVQLASDGRQMTVVVPTIRSGTSRITLSFSTR